jgi:threonine/homoserine/homoserine lactone efflux protein
MKLIPYLVLILELAGAGYLFLVAWRRLRAMYLAHRAGRQS